MKLRELHLDELVVIPGALDIAGGMPVKREQSFHADDGWDLREVLPGVFSITRAEMPHAVTVGGFGYSYVPAPFDHEEHARFEEAIGLLSARTVDPEREAGMSLVGIQIDSAHGPIPVTADPNAPPGGWVHVADEPAPEPSTVPERAQQHHRKGKR